MEHLVTNSVCHLVVFKQCTDKVNQTTLTLTLRTVHDGPQYVHKILISVGPTVQPVELKQTERQTSSFTLMIISIVRGREGVEKL